MEIDKKQLIKDKYVLKKIEENVDNVMGTSILNVYNKSNVCENYLEVLNKIYKIEFPVLITKEKGCKNYEYVEYLYQHLNLPINSYNWLIPYFNESNWWIEFKIENISIFLNAYYPNNISINLTAIDTKNKLLFDIENGEFNFEYRIMCL
ncbi:MAG: hypothetical protein HDR22_02110 [Lachnospiraceae bacterium]|nr:hypothetical protein [Lachnospiraceae bacterium]